MFDLGIGEMMLIAVLVIVFVGPDGLPDMMRVMGRFYGQMRRASDDLRRTFNAEVARVDSDRRRDDLRQRREERERARAVQGDAAGAAPEPPALEADDLHDEHGALRAQPALLAADPRLPPDAAPRAVPRPAPMAPRPAPPVADPELSSRPPADPAEH